ncbi:MAG: hypothetical protein JNG86_18635 [Verrucomicrobiaceae bacterium]|jgi:hypothetical protein|nr:hypothetical protein [Verrucomicrobiaceae bacterium]
MPAQLELETNASIFGVITEIRLTERPSRKEPVNETQLSVLAHEITRYMPGLADMLAASGREKLLAA